MPIELFPEDLLASTYTRIRYANAIKVDIDLFAETWTIIDEATSYSSELFVFSYTEIDPASPANIDLFADTYTQIDDIVYGEYLDHLFYISVDHVDQWPFDMRHDQPYLDTSFLTYIPDYLDHNFRIENTDPYYDVTFNYAVYDFEDWSFDMRHDQPYVDITFQFTTGAILDVFFFVPFPDYLEFDFIAGLADYTDIHIHIPMTWYFAESNFRMKHVPTFLSFLDHSFLTKVTQYVEFSIELVSLNRQLPATITIKGNLDD